MKTKKETSEKTKEENTKLRISYYKKQGQIKALNKTLDIFDELIKLWREDRSSWGDFMIEFIRKREEIEKELKELEKIL